MQEVDIYAKWGIDYLVSTGHSMEHLPETVLSTPWSTVIRFSTSAGVFYLKQTPPSISLEPKIIKLLLERFHASVPFVLDANDDLHCFIMKDAGESLRKTLKSEFNSELLCQAIKQYAAIQRATEDHVALFFELGVPDWRLSKIPILYDQMITQTDFLISDGMTDKELQILRDLSPRLLAQCKLLSSYRIPETIGIPDFHDNNILFDSNAKIMTFIDWGEASISHPFFSLKQCLLQVISHHSVKEGDQIYNKLQDACLESWLGSIPKKELLDMFNLSKQLWPIYDALANYRLMTSVDLQTLNTFYANKPNRLAKAFREYIAVSIDS